MVHVVVVARGVHETHPRGQRLQVPEDTGEPVPDVVVGQVPQEYGQDYRRVLLQLGQY